MPSTRGALVGALLCAAVAVVACDQLATDAPAADDVFDAPIDGLSHGEAAAFVRGDAEFARRFAPSSGLGPVFNNASCAACHSGDGRGFLENALHRIGSADDDFLRPLGGPQIQDKAIPGAEPEPVPTGVPVSMRLPPPVFGMGLIEAIPDATILALADSADRDGDGISGRPNWVRAAEFVPAREPGGGTGLKLGRFGRKAQNSSILQQVAEAYLQDIGITSDFLPLENRNPRASVPVEALDHVADPEIPGATVLAVAHYVRTLAPPAFGAETPLVSEGGALFTTVKCASCHVPSLQTGPSTIAALSNRPARLYSDLLLHDLGDALADGRPDGAATGREWRTTPLWGLRLLRRFLDGRILLMHDGRARSIDEAILLHGGEAAASREAYARLTIEQKLALVAYVESR
jgi:CxxC motif-containing protein (DUF1111 family)